MSETSRFRRVFKPPCNRVEIFPLTNCYLITDEVLGLHQALISMLTAQ